MLDTRIQIRMSTEEVEDVKMLADEFGLSVSDFIRYLIAEHQAEGGEE